MSMPHTRSTTPPTAITSPTRRDADSRTDAMLPQDCHDIGEELGFAVSVTWSPTPGLMDVIFTDITTRPHENTQASVAVSDVYLPTVHSAT